MQLKCLEVKDVYIKNRGSSEHRPGKIAKVIGVKWCTPNSYGCRLAYEIKYADGFIDYISTECKDLYILYGRDAVIEYASAEFEWAEGQS